MEVDEIRQEEAETALVEDDDQGSDYEVDEYLDDTSKTLSILIHDYLDTHQAEFSELAKLSTDECGDDDENGDSDGESDSDDEDDPMD